MNVCNVMLFKAIYLTLLWFSRKAQNIKEVVRVHPLRSRHVCVKFHLIHPKVTVNIFQFGPKQGLKFRKHL